MIHSLVDFLPENIVRKTCVCEDPYSMEFMGALINHFIKNPDPKVVPILNYKKIKKLMYVYEMPQLDLISPQEDQLIDEVGDAVFSHGKKACTVIEYAHPGVREVFPVLFPFLEQIVLEDRYWDIHSGNIMIHNGNYKLIDLEGFLNEPLNDSINDWITRDAPPS